MVAVHFERFFPLSSAVQPGGDSFISEAISFESRLSEQLFPAMLALQWVFDRLYSILQCVPKKCPLASLL